MNIFRLAAELFLIYIIYKLIFEFIIPIFESTKKIKKQFGDMQTRMEQEMNETARKNASAPAQPKVKREGDYIEYEEIK